MPPAAAAAAQETVVPPSPEHTQDDETVPAPPPPVVVPDHPAVTALDEIQTTHRQLHTSMKSMEGALKRLNKELAKLCKKRKKPSGAHNNLVRPVQLSDELCAFLELEPGSSLTRGQVTSGLNKYAVGIKKPGDGKIVIVDEPLSKLLGVDVGTEVQLFGMQGHLKARGHYLDQQQPPADADATSAATAATAAT